MKTLRVYIRSDITGNPVGGFDVIMSDEEYNRWNRTKELPIIESSGTKVWFDEKFFVHREHNLPAYLTRTYSSYRVHGRLHRTNGPAMDCKDGNVFYYLNGKAYYKNDYEKLIFKRIYFLREKIICLKNLLEIPELFDEVYYTRKNEFISLMKKI